VSECSLESTPVEVIRPFHSKTCKRLRKKTNIVVSAGGTSNKIYYAGEGQQHFDLCTDFSLTERYIITTIAWDFNRK
jgi:hypothetical protein